VLLGAGAKILGNIEVGEYSRVAAGSVVPAKIVATHQNEPYREMDQVLKAFSYDAFAYAI
jgi:serine O-acetyltransferase